MKDAFKSMKDALFNNLTKLSKVSREKIQSNRFCFIPVGVWIVLRFLVSINNLEQYKKLP